ncbi:hypothetical protein ACN47E_008340 [Coniothyrium glycines]
MRGCCEKALASDILPTSLVGLFLFFDSKSFTSPDVTCLRLSVILYCAPRLPLVHTPFLVMLWTMLM